MSVATSNILKLLSELSATADKVVEERESEFKLPRLQEWISTVEDKADDIVEGESATESEVPNLVAYLRGTSALTCPRVSTVLTEIQRRHLHKKEKSSLRKARKSRQSSILKTPSRRKSSAKVSVQSQENITPKLKIPPMVIKKTGIGFSQIVNSSTSIEKERNKVTPPVSSFKRKSSSELLGGLENVKKPKTYTQLNYPQEQEKLMPKIIEKQIKAKNSSLLPSYGNNIKSSVGLTNASVLKENRTLRSKMETKQEKAVENRKNLMVLRQQKLEENKKNRDAKMEKTLQQRLKLEKQKMGKLRSAQEQEKNLTPTPKTMQKIVTENPDKEKQTSGKMQLNRKKMGTSLLKSNGKTPVSQKNIKYEKTLNTTYVATGGEEPSTSNKGKILIDSNLGALKTHKKGAQIVSANSSTPVQKKGSESYAITPARSSFVSYDISEIRSDSEEDEQETNSKPIPSWATGICLRNALLQQHHHPIDTDELFGNFVDLPDLAVIMGIKKKHYNKRTSSAIWNSSFSFS